MRVALIVLTAFSLTHCAYLSHTPASNGRPSSGWLQRATRFPDNGRTWRVLRNDAAGGQHWGTQRIVGMITQSARGAYNAQPGAALTVGDISAMHGGQIPHHASHRTGRDVDLLFFARDGLTNEPVLTPDFVHYDTEGNSVRYLTPLRFDVRRNWDLVEAVLRSNGVAVIRIFVATWIERLLLIHARQRAKPEWLISRAEQVMHQPGDAAPHDDHFHVRIACTPAERVAGCVDYGPLWPWTVKDWEKDDSVSADDDTVLAGLAPLPLPPEPRARRRR
jgi:penicillin-insensitive murein DD-endopeptidase